MGNSSVCTHMLNLAFSEFAATRIRTKDVAATIATTKTIDDKVAQKTSFNNSKS